MKNIPETRTEMIDLFTSEKIFCTRCNQTLVFKKRSSIHCPSIPGHSGHVVLECSGCGAMTTIDKVCSEFKDLRDLLKNNQYEISTDAHSIPEYPGWLSYYCNPDMESEGWIYPSIFNWKEFWKEIQSHTNLKPLIGVKDENNQNICYSFNTETKTIDLTRPEEGSLKISLSDFKNVLEKMEKNKKENKDYFDTFSNFEEYVHRVWRESCRGKNFWE